MSCQKFIQLFESEIREAMTNGDCDSKLSRSAFFVLLRALGVSFTCSTDWTSPVEDRFLSTERKRRYTRSPLLIIESWLPTLAISKLCTLSAATLIKSLLKFALIILGLAPNLFFG